MVSLGGDIGVVIFGVVIYGVVALGGDIGWCCWGGDIGVVMVGW